MLENFQRDSWGSIPPLRMSSLLPHDLCTMAAPIYVSTNSTQHLLFLVFLIIVIPVGERWLLIVVFICISLIIQFSSVTQSCPTLWDPVDCSTPGLPVHHQLLEFTQTHVHWVSDAINHLILCCPFLLCLQSFPASGSFQMNQLFASGGQCIRVSASTSVLLMNTQDWSPLGGTGWIFLQSKGLWRVFSNTTVQKHQFFDAQLSL